MLKTGDKVVMHTCGEADHYKGKIWTCKTDEFTSSAKQQVVFLEGFSGYFLVEYLQIVDLDELKLTLKQLRKKSEQEINFGEALFEQGDKANGHFREGLGRGILFSVSRIEERL